MKSKNIVVSLLLMVQGVFASNEPSKSPLGEALMSQARVVYMQQNPEAQGKLKTFNTVADARILSEIATLTQRIPNLCYDDNGALLPLEVNAKSGEYLVKFTNNSDYKTALAVIRPYNSPEGLHAMTKGANTGISLRFVESFDHYKALYGHEASQKIAEKKGFCSKCHVKGSDLHVPMQFKSGELYKSLKNNKSHQQLVSERKAMLRNQGK